jgi:glucokinase
MKILAADIGGTSARFGHFEAEAGGELHYVASEWLETQRSSSFGELMRMLEESGFELSPRKADIVSIAIAGPVVGGVKSYPPNISWDVDLSNAAQDFGFRNFSLLNDFAAQAYACRSPIMREAKEILPGEIDYDAAAAVIGAGTGLGHAALIPDERGGHLALASEGGHMIFPFTTKEEFEYGRFLREVTGREQIIGDLVVSGSGLSLLHQFLSGEKLEPKEVAGKLEQSPETLNWYGRFYGRACRNFALLTVAVGGLYVSGGVAAKTPLLVENEHFRKEFRSSQTHPRLLSRISVLLNANQESGLWGAALRGFQILTLR